MTSSSNSHGPQFRPDIAPAPMKPVDVWAMQHTLMAASNQPLPVAPEINVGVLLYAALNLEEGSESLRGLVRALIRIGSAGDATPESIAIQGIANELHGALRNMEHVSKAVRSQIKRLPRDWRAELESSELKEIADGNIDLMVTNAGLSLSLGLDGGMCYEDVASSNLSKRNPDDGTIHVDASGKWIKDPRTYREPTLLQTIGLVIAARQGIVPGDMEPALAAAAAERDGGRS